MDRTLLLLFLLFNLVAAQNGSGSSNECGKDDTQLAEEMVDNANIGGLANLCLESIASSSTMTSPFEQVTEDMCDAQACHDMVNAATELLGQFPDCTLNGESLADLLGEVSQKISEEWAAICDSASSDSGSGSDSSGSDSGDSSAKALSISLLTVLAAIVTVIVY